MLIDMFTPPWHMGILSRLQKRRYEEYGHALCGFLSWFVGLVDDFFCYLLLRSL